MDKPEQLKSVPDDVWEVFYNWSQEEGVSFDAFEDWWPWWVCWKNGFDVGQGG